MKKKNILFRHGDVLIARIDDIPKGAKKIKSSILVKGEVTGHSHRINNPLSAQLWNQNNSIYLEVISEKATLVHEEHNPIELAQGKYRVWVQREYTPRAIINVRD